MIQPDITDLHVIFYPRVAERRIFICNPFSEIPENIDPEVNYVIPEGYLVAEDHQSIGLLLHEISKLEGVMGFLLTRFLEAPIEKSTILTHYVSGNSLIEMLRNLGIINLDDENQRELIKLLERMSSLNSKRNKIVHGEWIIEASVFIDRKNNVAYKNRVYRYYRVSSKKLLRALSDSKEQKIRVNHYFDRRRIIGVMFQARKLNEDLQKFLESIDEQGSQGPLYWQGVQGTSRN